MIVALISFVGGNGYEQMHFDNKTELRSYVARVLSDRSSSVNGIVACGWHWSVDYGWSRCRDVGAYLS